MQTILALFPCSKQIMFGHRKLAS